MRYRGGADDDPLAPPRPRAPARAPGRGGAAPAGPGWSTPAGAGPGAGGEAAPPRHPFDLDPAREAEIDRDTADMRRLGGLGWRPPARCEPCERCGAMVMPGEVDDMRWLVEYVGHDFGNQEYFRPHGPTRCGRLRAGLLAADPNTQPPHPPPDAG